MVTVMSEVRRTLLGFAVFLALVGLGVGAYIYNLEKRADAIDQLPSMLYDQPVWSQDEEQIAYLARPIHGHGDARVTGGLELWRCPRVSGEAVKIGDLAEPCSLLGWVDEDKSLLLQPTSTEGPPRVLLAAVDGSGRQEIRFEREGLELIGARGGEIFFQRKADKGVDILTWAPGKSRFTKLVNMPDTGEELRVEDAMPSADGRWAALILRLGQNPGSLGLWLYDKKQERLVWTNIRVEAKAMRMAWSPDSTGLVAAAELEDGCDLFALWSVEKLDYARLNASSSQAPVPFWPKGEDAFFLLEGDTVYRFEPEGLRAERILSRHEVGQPLLDLAISPRGTYAVFHCRDGRDDVLYRWGLKTRKNERLLKPDERLTAKGQLWYQIADGLRYAASRWLPGR
jgi:hypothetical protein